MRKFSTTGILALIVAAVLAYVYFVEYKHDEEKKVEKAENQKLFKAKPEDITEVHLKWAAGQTDLVRNEKNEWNIAAPISDSVDNSAMATLLQSISSESSEDVVVDDPQTDLAVFGLKDPLGSVTIKKKDGSVQTVEFGQVEALQKKKYVKTGSKVVVISAYVESRFVKTPRDLRQKKISRLDWATASDISIKSNEIPSFDVSLHNEGGSWSYVGQKWDVDSSLVASFLNQAQGLMATDFPSEDKESSDSRKNFMTQQTKLAITVKSKEGSSETLIVHGMKDDKVFVTTSLRPTVFQINKTAFESFKIAKEQFRNRSKPFQFNKDNVESIEIESELTNLKLTKQPSGWNSDTIPKGKTVDQLQVKHLLDQLSGLKAEQYLGELRKKLLTAPRGMIVLKTKSGEPELELKWGPDVSDKERLVITNKTAEAVSVAKSVLSSLPLQTLVQDEPTKAPEKTQSPETKK